MLTVFKGSSLASAFYRPENKGNGGPLKWNFGSILGMQR